jgi:hypothetical protein
MINLNIHTAQLTDLKNIPYRDCLLSVHVPVRLEGGG